MSALLRRLLRTDPARARFCEGAALCDHGERCSGNCNPHLARKPLTTSPTSFWWAYALLLVAVVALARAVL